MADQVDELFATPRTGQRLVWGGGRRGLFMEWRKLAVNEVEVSENSLGQQKTHLNKFECVVSFESKST